MTLEKGEGDNAATNTAKPDGMEDVEAEKMRFINGSEEIYPSVKIEPSPSKESSAVQFNGLTKQELMAFADDPFWMRIRSALLLTFWVMWFGMLITAVLIIALTPGCPKQPEMTWVQKANVYQIFPRSFLDTDNNGIGDIKGVTEKLDYLKSKLGVDALWVNPFFPSDMVDAGYDVINHTAIDERYGNMEDFEGLVKTMHKKGMKLIIDFIPNHTSKKHKWFKESRKSKTNSFANFYVWHPGTAGKQPPNNWMSVNGGSAWTFDETRKEFYLHQFHPDQPDLNLRNKEVVTELQKTLSFWMKKGVDGFHLVNADYLFESESLDVNEEVITAAADKGYKDLRHNLTKYQPETFKMVGEWSKFVQSFESNKIEPYLILDTDGDEKVVQMYKEADEQGGIHIRTDSALTKIDGRCLGECVYKLVTSLVSKEVMWPMWMTGDKYSSRVASRMGSKYVNAMNMFLMTMRGTPITYYGEEVGMIDLNLTSADTSKFNMFGSSKPLTPQELKYDEARSPMQWSASKNAGFTSVQNPWRPIGSNYLTANVQTEQAHGIGVSHVEVYRLLSALRSRPAIRFGELSPIGAHGSVVAFVRHAHRFQHYLVAINFGPLDATLDFVAAKPDLVQRQGRVIVTTSNFQVPGEFEIGTTISLERVFLRPSEGLVVEML